LRGVSFEVQSGEIFGFLGPNGAGKTTTIRLLLDLIRPTSGRAEIFGIDTQRRTREVRARIGYLPGELALYGDMSGRDTLDLLLRLSGGAPDPALRGTLLERLAFPQADLRRRVREYSTGMRRKLGIVQAMQHDPPLLILDEPTEGLDPLMQEALYDVLTAARRRGTTIFMSSHVLSEVERTCDRLALLRGGEVVLVSTVDELRRVAPRLVRIAFDSDTPAPPPLPESFEIEEAAPRLWRVRASGELRELLAAAGAYAIGDIEIGTPRLEDVIFRYYAKGSE
jgi:ABC-2 type transport system ATP-binding protein